MRSFRLLTLAVTLLATIVTSARAHEAGELTMIATVRATQLDLVVTLATSTAARLLDPSAETPPPVTPATFPTVRERLIAVATAHFFTFTTAPTTAPRRLALRTVTVALTAENDLAFTLLYPRPAAGPLHLRAIVFARLGPGHGGILECTDTAGHHLGWDQLSPEKPALTIVIPAP
jgi:hypothetical protein